MYPSKRTLFRLSFQKFIVGECCLRDAGCFVSVTLTPPMVRSSVLGSSCCCVCGTPWGRWEFRASHWRKLMDTWKRYGLVRDDQVSSTTKCGNFLIMFVELGEFAQNHIILEEKTFSDSETVWLEWYMHAAWRIRVGTYKIIVVVRLTPACSHVFQLLCLLILCCFWCRSPMAPKMMSLQCQWDEKEHEGSAGEKLGEG